MSIEGEMTREETNEHADDTPAFFPDEAAFEQQGSPEEIRAEEMLRQMEMANIRADIDGESHFGSSWNKAIEWGKAGWDWVKRPSETYTEAIGKAALFSAGTTVFLAPVFLYRNCKQVYDAHRKVDGGTQLAHA